MQQSQVLLEQTIPSYESFQELANSLMNKIVFFDKTLTEWIDHLAIDIPSEVTLEQIREIYVRVAKQIQQVSFFMSMCSTYNSTLSSQSEAARADIVEALVTDYSIRNAKRPAAVVLNNLADSKLQDANLQLVVSRVLRDFWKERREVLVEVRKCLEQIMISHTSEMKYLPNN